MGNIGVLLAERTLSIGGAKLDAGGALVTVDAERLAAFASRALADGATTP